MRLRSRLVIAAVALITLSYGIWVVISPFRRIDYSTWPREKVFQMVWGRPLPASAHVRIAGHGAGQGHNIWMRIDAPRSTLLNLIGENEPISNQDFWKGWPARTEDARVIGWDEIKLLDEVIYYNFKAKKSRPDQGWYGMMAADLGAQRLYVFAEVL